MMVIKNSLSGLHSFRPWSPWKAVRFTKLTERTWRFSLCILGVSMGKHPNA
jgi:hypothetical protein